MMTTIELNKIKESLLNSVKNNFKKDGRLDPVMILIGQDGQLAFISTPYTNNIEKQMMINGVKSVCKETNPAAIAMINEAKMMPKNSNREDVDNFEKELKASGKALKIWTTRKRLLLLCLKLHIITK